MGTATRFAPIHDINGNCIPSLYAGSSLEAALFETVFHDVPPKAKLKTVARSRVDVMSHTTLVTNRQIVLAKLRRPDLSKWRVSRRDLIESTAKFYSQTYLWAEAIHHQFPHIDGLVWTSNQCDPDDAYLFYGDRVFESDFTESDTRDGSLDLSFLSDARTAGIRAGITIII
ncbi:MAG: RES domain-containing protein [Pseudomonadales bacterium]|nr:RES domain-containing protein [Pseudomonadales bacterium]